MFNPLTCTCWWLSPACPLWGPAPRSWPRQGNLLQSFNGQPEPCKPEFRQALSMMVLRITNKDRLTTAQHCDEVSTSGGWLECFPQKIKAQSFFQTYTKILWKSFIYKTSHLHRKFKSGKSCYEGKRCVQNVSHQGSAIGWSLNLHI